MGWTRAAIVRSWVTGLALAFASQTLAGETAGLRGRVVDRSGQPLPGSKLLLTNETLPFPPRVAVADAEGGYQFTGLPPGPGYRLHASLPGHGPVEFTGLELRKDEVEKLDIVLAPESELRETVRIAGQAPIINTESVTTSTAFSSEFIAGLPLLGREYQEVLTLAPGVTDVDGTGNPNVHGARDTGLMTLMDGVNITDPFTGYFGQLLNLESIQEIEVITSGATAEYSRAQGGFADISTKSGGNEFKGTFKFYLRTSRLDGDGAGADDPVLHGGTGDTPEFRSLSFTDLYPFLSLSGPVVRDRLWYYLTGEYTLLETPVNTLSNLFVTRTRGYRAFGKMTWQLTPSQKLVAQLSLDRTELENQGVDSLVDVESGYRFKRGGPTYTVRHAATLGPTRLLESAVGWFDNNFQQLPTLNPDTNHNGFTFFDDRPGLGGNGDGILQARERDPGMEFDRDGAWDLDEGSVVDPPWLDADGDGHATYLACEGEEDLDCDGLITTEVDANENGMADPEEDVGLVCFNPMRCPGALTPGTAGNGKLDTEDRNGNGLLDTVGTSGYTPYPFWVDSNGNGDPDRGEFEAPLPADVNYYRDSFARAHGPYPYQYDDHRQRLTLREDFSLFAGEFGGTHDVKLGAIGEWENFDRETVWRPWVTLPQFQLLDPHGSRGGPLWQTVSATVGVPSRMEGQADSRNLGLYLQDTYKPRPNLTLGLGLRVDFERVHTSGLTPFDPAEERRNYDRALDVAGQDTVEFDGITARGLAADPLYVDSGGLQNLHVAQISNELRELAPRYFTHDPTQLTVVSNDIARFLPGGFDSLDAFIAAGFQVRQPEEFTLENANVAPRFAVSWDPRGDGKAKGFGSWSRFYDRIFLEAVMGELGPETATRNYAFDKLGYDYVQGQALPNNGFGQVVASSATSGGVVDRNLRTPYTDEWTLGFQREVAPEVSVSVTYIHRDYRRQLQDVDINHFTRTDPATGRMSDYFGEYFCGSEILAICRRPPDPIRRDPPELSPPDGLPDLFVQSFLYNQILMVGNFNSQTYRGLELEFVRRLRRKWQLEASYTYSRAYGDAEGYRGSYGNDPSLIDYQPGYLAYDQRHVAKLNALAFLPKDWQLGGTLRWASGLPYSQVVQYNLKLDDAGYLQYRERFGYLDPKAGFVPEHRNEHRNRAVYEINARVQKNFVIGKGTASGFLEIFDLLNSDDLRVITSYPEEYALQLKGERQFGRRFQLGFQVDF